MRISRDNMHCYHLPAIRYLNRQDLLEKLPLTPASSTSQAPSTTTTLTLRN